MFPPQWRAPTQSGVQHDALGIDPGQQRELLVVGIDVRGVSLKSPNRKISKSFNNYSGSGRGASRANDFVTKRRSGFGQGAGGQKRRLPAARQNLCSNTQHHSHASPAVTVYPFRSSLRRPPRRCELSRPSSRRGPRPPRRSGRSQPSPRKGPNGRVAFADFEVG